MKDTKVLLKILKNWTKWKPHQIAPPSKKIKSKRARHDKEVYEWNGVWYFRSESKSWDMMDGGPVGNGVVKDEAAIGERQKRKNIMPGTLPTSKM
jgi:hypothetical protein